MTIKCVPTCVHTSDVCTRPDCGHCDAMSYAGNIYIMCGETLATPAIARTLARFVPHIVGMQESVMRTRYVLLLGERVRAHRRALRRPGSRLTYI